MQQQKQVFIERKILLIVLVLGLAIFGISILLMGKGPAFRAFTGYHSPSFDFFFRYLTHLGDGIFILALAALFAALKKYFLSLGIVAGYLLSGVFAQLGKRLLNMPRPMAYFESLGETVYRVPGMEVHLQGSFPSGHTASVFALAVFLVLALPYRWYSWLILLAACLVGYSRIYLSQHFPVDVWAGAIIGTFSGAFVFYYFSNIKKLKP